MTKDEYRAKLNKAIQDSVKYRWQRLANGVFITDVPYCFLCDLKVTVDPESLCLAVCPVCNHKWGCCDEYYEYCDGATPFAKKIAAHKMIERLEAIDVDAWTEKLSKDGVLDD